MFRISRSKITQTGSTEFVSADFIANLTWDHVGLVSNETFFVVWHGTQIYMKVASEYCEKVLFHNRFFFSELILLLHLGRKLALSSTAQNWLWLIVDCRRLKQNSPYSNFQKHTVWKLSEWKLTEKTRMPKFQQHLPIFFNCQLIVLLFFRRFKKWLSFSWSLHMVKIP